MGVFEKLTAIMFYVGLVLLIPTGYAYYLEEWIWKYFALSALILLVPSLPTILPKAIKSLYETVRALFRREIPWNYVDLKELFGSIGEKELKLGEALALTALAWIVIPSIGTIPYLAYGLSPVNAFFESMSGWTSTGLTVLEKPEEMPLSLIFYRSLTQWIGGFGIVILMLVVLKSKEVRTLFKSERAVRGDISIAYAVKTYWKIYLLLSLVGVGILIYTGINLFESINLTMAGISCGGFFPFSVYEFNMVQKVALSIIMFSGATSFVLYIKLFQGKLKEVLFDEEFLLYLSVLAVALLFLVYVGEEDLFNALFNSVSSLTSTGFSIGDIDAMHPFSQYILILLMLSGGMYGSTTGAIKLWRVLVVLKAVWLKIKTAFLPPGTIQVVKINGNAVDNETIMDVLIFMLFYSLLVFGSTGVMLALGYKLLDSLLLTASALGNVGVSTFSLVLLPPFEKIFLTFLMYVGRIEIFPAIAFIRMVVNIIKR